MLDTAAGGDNRYLVRERRATAYSCFFLALAVTALFIPALLGLRGLFHDNQAMEEFPRYFFLARNLQHGILPLWDPQTWCGGIPFYGRYHADTYYFPLWPFYFIANLRDLSQAYQVLILLPAFLHYILAACGMFLFLKMLFRCGYAAACLGAVAYVYSPAFSYSYVWQQVLTVQAWLPWLMLIFLSAAAEPRYWKIFFGAVVFSFILSGGEPNSWPFVGMVWCGVAIFAAVLKQKGREKHARISGLLGAALLIALLGALLSAPYLFSFIHSRLFISEYKPLSVPLILADAYGSLPPLYLSTLFIPDLFGNITGKLLPILSPGGTVFYWEANLNGGMALTFLVMTGFFVILNRESMHAADRRIKYGLVMAALLYILALLLVLGRFTPFYKWTLGLIPWAGEFPRPLRYRMLQCFASGILAAGSAEFISRWLGDRIFPGFKRWVWVYAFISLCVILTALLLPAATRGYFFYPWLGREGAVSIMGAEKFLLAFFRGGGAAARHLAVSLIYWFSVLALLLTGVHLLSRRRFAWFVGIIAVFELFASASLAFYGSTYSFDRPSLNHLRFSGPSVSPFVQRASEVEDLLPDKTLRVFSTAAFQDNFMRLGSAFALMGYEMHPMESRFKEAFENAFADKLDYPMYYRRLFPLPGSQAFLDNFSVGYILSPEKKPLFPGDNRVIPLDSGGAFLHFNSRALPRAYTVGRLKIAPEKEQLRQLASTDLRQEALIDEIQAQDPQLKAVLGRTEHEGFDALQKLNPLQRINLDDPNAVEMELEVGFPAMLVTSEIWYPGWEAWVDGVKTRIYRLNYCQRGLWLARGKHRVNMRFAPLPWRLGCAVSLATFLVMAGLLLFKRNARRMAA